MAKEQASNDEQIGFHKGALSTLAKEREEMMKILQIVEQLMQGLKEAADFSGITITGGEIAELGNRIGGYGNQMHFNWGATGIGIMPQGKDIVD